MNELNHYVPGFIANLSLLPQQKKSRLIQCVDADMNHTAPGKLFNADDLDVDDPEAVTARVPDSPGGLADHSRRVGFFSAFAQGVFIEDLDKVRMLTDPASTVMAGMMAKKWQRHDQRIIELFDGSSYNGENGATVTAFPSSQIIAADNRDYLHDAESVAGSGDLGLTVGKIIKSGVLLDQSEIDEDGTSGAERFFAITARQKGELLSSTPVTSADYATVKALAAGTIDSAFGFTFVRSELLPKAAGIRSCFAWMKKAVQFKVRPIKNARITEREDKSFRPYAYYEVEHGGLRRYDTGVVKILCAEA